MITHYDKIPENTFITLSIIAIMTNIRIYCDTSNMLWHFEYIITLQVMAVITPSEKQAAYNIVYNGRNIVSSQWQ